MPIIGFAAIMWPRKERLNLRVNSTEAKKSA